MPAKTVRQLRDDRKLLGSGNTRYGLYKGKHNEKPAARPPSLLLLLRGCNNLPNGNRDRVLNQIGTLIGQNCSNLRLAGRDIIDNGETRDLYSNRVGEEFLNQADAAVLRAIEMDDLAQNVLGGDQDITELIQSHLGYDYGTFYKTPTAAVNEILGWAGKYLATRYRHYWQMFYWAPHRNNQNYDSALALSGLFRLVRDPKDPRNLRGEEKRRRVADFKALFEHTWGLTVEYAIRLDNWYSSVFFELHSMRVKTTDSLDVMLPAFNTLLQLNQDILIAVRQRERFGGITLNMWNQIQTRANDVTRIVRNTTSCTRTDDPQNPHTFQLVFNHWRRLHRDSPPHNFPPIRRPPALYEESQARGVPPHLDGDGPGGDDDFNDFDDGSNPDANNNNNGNTDGGSNNNNDDGNNAGFGFDPNGPWFGNPVGSHWNAANQNAANQATRISGSISICDRCTHIFSQGDCPRCSGGFGDSILSPTERWQTVLSSEAAISIIRDTLRQATQGLIQGEGLPIDMARFRPSELWRQMGPEFQAQVA
ncbi:hypothetical protein CHU98_g10625 [Xylaria longipes]|nr:hypothetical protein CHU98_g10625 [Xylaria longipes]